MKRMSILLLLTVLMSFQTPVKEHPVPEEKNPIYNDFNEPIDFAALYQQRMAEEQVKAQVQPADS